MCVCVCVFDIYYLRMCTWIFTVCAYIHIQLYYAVIYNVSTIKVAIVNDMLTSLRLVCQGHKHHPRSLFATQPSEMFLSTPLSGTAPWRRCALRGIKGFNGCERNEMWSKKWELTPSAAVPLVEWILLIFSSLWTPKHQMMIAAEFTKGFHLESPCLVVGQPLSSLFFVGSTRDGNCTR